MEAVDGKITGKRPIRRRALHQEAVDSIREMIIGGALTPGARLVEAELCETFGISRTPLREALRVLEAEGLVRFFPHRGAEVSKISAQEVLEQFEVLANLERVALELAMARMSSADLNRLNRMHERMLLLYDDRKRRECFQKDYDIHDRIVSLAGNSVLENLHRALMVRSRRVRYFALHSESRWSQSMAEHDAFMKAVNAGDVDAASILMRDHVLRTGAIVSDFVSSHEDASPDTLEKSDRKPD